MQEISGIKNIYNVINNGINGVVIHIYDSIQNDIDIDIYIEDKFIKIIRACYITSISDNIEGKDISIYKVLFTSNSSLISFRIRTPIEYEHKFFVLT